MRAYRKAALMEALTARRDDSDDEDDVAAEEDYACKMARFASTAESKELAERFVQLDRDAETEAFIANCREWSGSSGALWKDFMSCCLRSCCSLTTTNALLRIGSMHVLSSHHIRTLLADHARGRLLDVGAGDGNVTMKYRPFFQEIITTEVNGAMAKRLRERGFPCVQTPEVTREALAAGLNLRSYSGDQLTFDVVSCLNVLDRCPSPKTLLRQIRDILRPDTGVLLLAVVLPFCPFVESGPAWSQVEPDEVLPVNSSRWENAVQDLVHKVFTPVGFRVKSFSRVPYLCCGMAPNQPVLQLDDAIFVLSPTTTEASC